MLRSFTYESSDYGIFNIQEQANKKFIVWWDPEECGDGITLDYIEDDYFTYCNANPRNLSSKSFEDISDEFNTHDEAYNYLISKFGNLN